MMNTNVIKKSVCIVFVTFVSKKLENIEWVHCVIDFYTESQKFNECQKKLQHIVNQWVAQILKQFQKCKFWMTLNNYRSVFINMFPYLIITLTKMVDQISSQFSKHFFKGSSIWISKFLTHLCSPQWDEYIHHLKNSIYSIFRDFVCIILSFSGHPLQHHFMSYLETNILDEM